MHGSSGYIVPRFLLGVVNSDSMCVFHPEKNGNSGRVVSTSSSLESVIKYNFTSFKFNVYVSLH